MTPAPQGGTFAGPQELWRTKRKLESVTSTGEKRQPSGLSALKVQCVNFFKEARMAAWCIFRPLSSWCRYRICPGLRYVSGVLRQPY